MTFSSPTFPMPGSRALAPWWDQLAPLHPLGLWLAHPCIVGIEAAVEFVERQPLDLLESCLLNAMRMESHVSLEALGRAFNLSNAWLRRAAGRLESQGCLKRVQADGWSITELGRQALVDGHLTCSKTGRRTFYFLALDAQAPRLEFLQLLDKAGLVPWPSPEDWKFDPVALLQDCIGQSTQWKEAHAFPLEVTRFVGIEQSPESGVSLSRWQGITYVTTAYLPTLLVLRLSDSQQPVLVGYRVQTSDWQLASEPSFRLASENLDWLTAAAPHADLDVWRSAWQSWCQSRALAGNAVQISDLSLEGCQLSVRVPRAVAEGLRTQTHGPNRHGAWLFAGTAAIRALARLQFVSD